MERKVKRKLERKVERKRESIINSKSVSKLASKLASEVVSQTELSFPKALFCQRSESLDDLILGDMKIIQAQKGYRFSLDAVLLAHFVDISKASSILDLGCGSGVISLLLAHIAQKKSKDQKNDKYKESNEENAKDKIRKQDKEIIHETHIDKQNKAVLIYALELQSSLYARAKRNIELNGKQDLIKLINCDLLQVEEYFFSDSFDCIVTNPPFGKLGEGKISQEPEIAIARHELKMQAEDIFAKSAYLLKPNGSLYLIQRAKRLREILELAEKYNFQALRLRMVQAFADSKPKLFLLEAIYQPENSAKLAKKKPELESKPEPKAKLKDPDLVNPLLAPLIIYQAPQEYSEEIKVLYE